MREKERRLEGRDLLLVGFTLFSMFFGAGNLIFPPNIAAQAGTQTWPAMLGLALSAVGLPVLGVVAVARSGGLDALGSRVHPAFARVFTIVAYLAIGPCLAIPRTATTSFEMAVPPFVGADAPIGVYQLVYSLVFFAAALFIALRPEKLTDRLGKILCPILVALIVVTFVGCLVNPLEGYGPATGDYATHAVVKGFIEGYQTMDTIAALAFGIVIAVNIRARGVEPLAHLTCITATRGEVTELLYDLKADGVENVLALRGDRNPDYPPKTEFLHADELVAFIRRRGDFGVSAACYPEGHPESPDAVSDLRYLKQKVDAGAQHLVSQLFFDNEDFLRFLERARIAGITVPIEAGIMPVLNQKSIERMVSLCGASIPRKLSRILARYGDHPEALREAGIAYAIDQISDLVAAGVDGIHLYTMNNPAVARQISDSVSAIRRV